MRHSILYPDTHRARILGIVCIGLIVFVIGAVVILQPWKRSATDTVSKTVPITGLEQLGALSGPVYWLDETQGKVSIVGEFRSSADGGRLDLNAPKAIIDSNARFSGLLWHDKSGSYIPHFNFLFNDDLQQRLQQVMESAKTDEHVQVALADFAEELFRVMKSRMGPELRRLWDTPELRGVLIDIVFSVAGERLPGRRNEDADQDTATKTGSQAGRKLVRILTEHTAGNMETWINDMAEDDDLRRAFEGLTVALESHFRQAMDEILWMPSPPDIQPGHDGTPNARVLWIARRILFGSRTPALLLVSDPEQGMPLTEKPFKCRVAQ